MAIPISTLVTSESRAFFTITGTVRSPTWLRNSGWRAKVGAREQVGVITTAMDAWICLCPVTLKLILPICRPVLLKLASREGWVRTFASFEACRLCAVHADYLVKVIPSIARDLTARSKM